MQKFSIEGYYYLLLSKLRTRMKFMLPCEVLKLIMLLPNALFSKKPPDPLLPEEAHGQRSLEGYSPQGLKASGMTEMTEYTQRP